MFTAPDGQTFESEEAYQDSLRIEAAADAYHEKLEDSMFRSEVKDMT